MNGRVNPESSARPARYINGPAALVIGYPAVVFTVVLRDLARRGYFGRLAPADRAEVLQLIADIERVGVAWQTKRSAASAPGSPETPLALAVASSPQHEALTVEEAARMLHLTPRRVRQLAAGGLGTKRGHTWQLDRAAVLAELERREEAA